MKQSGMESIHAMLMRSQLRWAGHVVRMPDEHLPKELLLGELCAGKHSKRDQKKCFKDTLKTSPKCCNIDPNTWEDLAYDRPAWRSKVCPGVMEYEKQRISNAIEKYLERKERACNPPPTGQQLHPCQQCDRLFRVPTRVRSHLWTHHA